MHYNPDKKNEALTHCQRYFDNFLPSLLNRPLIEGLHHLTCTFAYRVPDNAGLPWRIEIDSGHLLSVGRDGPPPMCCYVCDAPTLLDIVSARVPPQEAFFDLRVELEGDLELGLSLSAVLEHFFQRYPYTE